MSETIPQRAAKGAGGVTKLARGLGISHQAVLKWKKVPAERVLAVERLSGLSRHIIRPDLYPVSTASAPQSSAGSIMETRL